MLHWRYSVVFVVMFLMYAIAYHFYGILCLAFLASGLASVSARLREAVHEKNGRNAIVSLISSVLHFAAVSFFLDWDRIVIGALSFAQTRALVAAMATTLRTGEWAVNRQTVIFPDHDSAAAPGLLGIPSVTERSLLAGRVGEQFIATAIICLMIDMLFQFVLLSVKALLSLVPPSWIVWASRAVRGSRERVVAAPQAQPGRPHEGDASSGAGSVEQEPLVGGPRGGAGALRVRGDTNEQGRDGVARDVEEGA